MIVRWKPEVGLDQADQAWFDSDAPTNSEAIREIDAEAARHGLVRTREYWLQTFSLPDGRVVRRGFCYRPEPSNIAERVAERRGTDVVGAPSSELIRASRDEE
jgi:predicted polyphosphate/ATP-dependent NAD kinase